MGPTLAVADGRHGYELGTWRKKRGEDADSQLSGGIGRVIPNSGTYVVFKCLQTIKRIINTAPFQVAIKT